MDGMEACHMPKVPMCLNGVYLPQHGISIDDSTTKRVIKTSGFLVPNCEAAILATGRHFPQRNRVPQPVTSSTKPKTNIFFAIE